MIRRVKDITFARNIIAEAQRRYLLEKDAPPDSRESTVPTEKVPEMCIYCTHEPQSKTHEPYCSRECAVFAEVNG